MAIGIIEIDMHIRDERILERLKQCASPSGEIKVSADRIAKEFQCHPNTARTILRRLIGAGRIEVNRRSFCGGHIYRVRRENC